MVDWTSFLVGACIALALCLPVLLHLFITWRIPESRNDEMIKGLIQRLAKSEKQLALYKDAYEQSWHEAEELRNEKLSNWGIPDRLP